MVHDPRWSGLIPERPADLPPPVPGTSQPTPVPPVPPCACRAVLPVAPQVDDGWRSMCFPPPFAASSYEVAPHEVADDDGVAELPPVELPAAPGAPCASCDHMLCVAARATEHPAVMTPPSPLWHHWDEEEGWHRLWQAIVTGPIPTPRWLGLSEREAAAAHEATMWVYEGAHAVPDSEMARWCPYPADDPDRAGWASGWRMGYTFRRTQLDLPRTGGAAWVYGWQAGYEAAGQGLEWP